MAAKENFALWSAIISERKLDRASQSGPVLDRADSTEIAQELVDVATILTLFEDNREFMRHHENQRSVAANIFLSAIASLLVILTTATLKPATSDAITCLAFLLSLYGWLLISKLNERIRLHGERARALLNVAAVDAGVQRALREIEERDRKFKRGRLLSAVRLRVLYPFMFLVAAIWTGFLVVRDVSWFASLHSLISDSLGEAAAKLMMLQVFQR